MIRVWMVLCGLLLAGALPGTGRAAMAQSGVTDRSRGGVTCASDDGKRHYCQLDTSRGVQMVKQRSGSPCVENQTWGADRRGVWVDRGCRAEFAVGGGNGWNGPGNGNGNGWNRPGNGNGNGWNGPGNGNGNGWNGPGNGNGNGWNGPGNGGGQRVTCSSDNGKRNRCNVNTSRGVQMVNQRSGSPCVQNQTWGYDQRGIWVDRGCRADFVAGR